MRNFYKHDSSISSNLRFHGLFWILFLSFFFLVMIIPSIIVYGTGDVEHIEALNGSNSKLQKGQNSSQKSSLTIGWISGNNLSLEHLTDYKNLKVVSPDIASVDNQYNFQVTSDSSLTSTIQKQGKVVWPLVTMRTDTKTNVHAFLASSNKTQEVIKKIYQSALNNNWYGVNLDIENVSSSDRVAFSQFVENLAVELNKASIILSIDLPLDPNAYDHEIIGKYCDYIVFMGYDQHWSTDPVPGPVTSLSWLKENLQEIIQTGIPSEKIILGLPAYTRIWEENERGQIVKDPAEPIQYVESLLEQNHRNLSWDSTLGEYYSSYTLNNQQYKIWLPTAKSFNLYLNLISQFHLAGSAVWNLNQIDSTYWNQIFKN